MSFLRAHWREAFILALILLLAAWLRLVNVGDNPGWYTDEGTHLDIAHHIKEGRFQYMAVGQSILLFQKMPLFEALLALVVRGGSADIDGLRLLTGSLGVLSVAALYVFARYATVDAPMALLAAFMHAIYPQAVLYSRFGFSYNLLPPLVLLAACGLWAYVRKRDRRGLVLASLAIGVGLTSDLMMGTFLAPLVLTALLVRRRDVCWSAPLSMLPLGLYLLALWHMAPQAALFDGQFSVYQVSHAAPIKQLAVLWENLYVLWTQDGWFPASLVGLWLLRPTGLRWLCLALFLLPILVMGRAVALFSLSFYYMIPLLPFASLGVAALVRYGVPFIARVAERLLGAIARRWRTPSLVPVQFALPVMLWAAALFPFGLSLGATLTQVESGFPTAIGSFLLDPDSVRAAASFVNARLSASDYVLASPGAAWLLHTATADFQMAIAVTGHATPHLPANVPTDRFTLDPHYPRAHYIIVDNLWRNWAAVDVPGVRVMLDDIATWPRVFQAGALIIYCNPAYCAQADNAFTQ